MTNTHPARPACNLTLRALTAYDLMSPNPLSLRDSITVREAIAFLIDRGISGAPVIDEAGRPIGVLTQTDILIHDRQTVEHATPEFDNCAPLPRKLWDEFQIEKVDATPVRDIMTPAIFSVGFDAPAWQVIEELRDLNVHRLFVVDANGVLVGVVTALDVIRHLHRPREF